MSIRAVFFASLLAGTAVASTAQDVAQHPAVSSSRPLAGVHASTFIVGHPASPSWNPVHANHEHPAVAIRGAVRRAIDPNTFIVQPPATVEWKFPTSLAVDSVASNQRF